MYDRLNNWRCYGELYKAQWIPLIKKATYLIIYDLPVREHENENTNVKLISVSIYWIVKWLNESENPFKIITHYYEKKEKPNRLKSQTHARRSRVKTINLVWIIITHRSRRAFKVNNNFHAEAHKISNNVINEMRLVHSGWLT